MAVLSSLAASAIAADAQAPAERGGNKVGAGGFSQALVRAGPAWDEMARRASTPARGVGTRGRVGPDGRRQPDEGRAQCGRYVCGGAGADPCRQYARPRRVRPKRAARHRVPLRPDRRGQPEFSGKSPPPMARGCRPSWGPYIDTFLGCRLCCRRSRTRCRTKRARNA